MASVFNLNSIFLSVNHYRMKEVMLFRQLDGWEGTPSKEQNTEEDARQSVAIATLKLVKFNSSRHEWVPTQVTHSNLFP